MSVFDLFRRALPPDPGAPPGLDGAIERLRDGDWRVRKAAAEELGELGALAKAAMPALEAAISDEHGEVCLAASDALSKIRLAAY